MLVRSPHIGTHGALWKIVVTICFLARTFFVYEPGSNLHYNRQSYRNLEAPESSSASSQLHVHGPAKLTEDEDSYGWKASQRLKSTSWPGKSGRSQMTKESRQLEQLAVLLSCWSDCTQASFLSLHLSNLLRQQGIPFRIYLLEQEGGALFNPGLLTNVGVQLALKSDRLFVPDYIGWIRPSFMPYVNVSFEYPSSPFLHLATEQHMYNDDLPYNSYCGGAWLAHVGFLQKIGGLASTYVGYELVGDDLCRRVLHQLEMIKVPEVVPGNGMFTVMEETPQLMQLAQAYRARNRKEFRDRQEVIMKVFRNVVGGREAGERGSIEAEDEQERPKGAKTWGSVLGKEGGGLSGAG